MARSTPTGRRRPDPPEGNREGAARAPRVRPALASTARSTCHRRAHHPRPDRILEALPPDAERLAGPCRAGSVARPHVSEVTYVRQWGCHHGGARIESNGLVQVLQHRMHGGDLRAVDDLIPAAGEVVPLRARFQWPVIHPT